MTKPEKEKAVVGKGKGAAVKKDKAVAFVNWKIADADGETLLRSSKGFSLFDNEYLTLEEKALIALAKNNGGRATVVAELTIVISHEKPESLDISKIQLVK